MTAALYRHTDRLPDGTTAYGCHTLARDGRTPVPLGCGHRTPREAIAHKSGEYVPASRSAPDGGRDQGQSETPLPPGSASPSAPPSRDTEPVAAGALQLGLL